MKLSTAEPTRFAELPELSAQKIGRRQIELSKKGFRAPPTGAEELYRDYDRAFPRRVVSTSFAKGSDSIYEGRAPTAEEFDGVAKDQVWDEESSNAMPSGPPPSMSTPRPVTVMSAPMSKLRAKSGGIASALGGMLAAPAGMLVGAAQSIARGGGGGEMSKVAKTRSEPGAPVPRLDYGGLVMARGDASTIAGSSSVALRRSHDYAHRHARRSIASRCRRDTRTRGITSTTTRSSTDGAVDVKSDATWHSIALTATRRHREAAPRRGAARASRRVSRRCDRESARRPAAAWTDRRLRPRPVPRDERGRLTRRPAASSRSGSASTRRSRSRATSSITRKRPACCAAGCGSSTRSRSTSRTSARDRSTSRSASACRWRAKTTTTSRSCSARSSRVGALDAGSVGAEGRATARRLSLARRAAPRAQKKTRARDVRDQDRRQARARRRQPEGAVTAPSDRGDGARGSRVDHAARQLRARGGAAADRDRARVADPRRQDADRDVRDRARARRALRALRRAVARGCGSFAASDAARGAHRARGEARSRTRTWSRRADRSAGDRGARRRGARAISPSPRRAATRRRMPTQQLAELDAAEAAARATRRRGRARGRGSGRGARPARRATRARRGRGRRTSGAADHRRDRRAPPALPCSPRRTSCRARRGGRITARSSCARPQSRSSGRPPRACGRRPAKTGTTSS